MNHFSSCFQDSVLLAFWQFIWVSVWISLSSAYLGLCWAFQRLIITSFQTQEVLSHYFFKRSLNPFLSLFPLELQKHICRFVYGIYKSLRLFTIYFSLFSFCSLDSIISIFLSSSTLALSSDGSFLPLDSSSELFTLIIVHFSSRVSFLVYFYVFCMLTDISILFIYLFIDLLHTFF